MIDDTDIVFQIFLFCFLVVLLFLNIWMFLNAIKEKDPFWVFIIFIIILIIFFVIIHLSGLIYKYYCCSDIHNNNITNASKISKIIL